MLPGRQRQWSLCDVCQSDQMLHKASGKKPARNQRRIQTGVPSCPPRAGAPGRRGKRWVGTAWRLPRVGAWTSGSSVSLPQRGMQQRRSVLLMVQPESRKMHSCTQKFSIHNTRQFLQPSQVKWCGFFFFLFSQSTIMKKHIAEDALLNMKTTDKLDLNQSVYKMTSMPQKKDTLFFFFIRSQTPTLSRI